MTLTWNKLAPQASKQGAPNLNPPVSTLFSPFNDSHHTCGLDDLALAMSTSETKRTIISLPSAMPAQQRISLVRRHPGLLLPSLADAARSRRGDRAGMMITSLRYGQPGPQTSLPTVDDGQAACRYLRVDRHSSWLEEHPV